MWVSILLYAIFVLALIPSQVFISFLRKTFRSLWTLYNIFTPTQTIRVAHINIPTIILIGFFSAFVVIDCKQAYEHYYDVPYLSSSQININVLGLHWTRA